jgi:hypothetical protein
VYLPTELCHEASLPDNFTTDARKMRDIDEYKIKNPNERFRRIVDVLNRIYNDNEFSNFNIQLKPEMHKCTGKVLVPPTLQTDRGPADWDDYANRKVKHSDPVQLNEEKWTLIYSAYDYERANKMIDMMKQASSSFGIRV